MRVRDTEVKTKRDIQRDIRSETEPKSGEILERERFRKTDRDRERKRNM